MEMWYYYFMKKGYIYILFNKRNGTLYTGVTSDLVKRVYQHKNKFIKCFTNTYNVDKIYCLGDVLYHGPRNNLPESYSPKEVIEEFKPIKVILSGGVANKLAKISEAEAMESYLLKKGISKDLLIKENKSMSTYENAFYSVPLARSLNADTIIVCTSDYHLANGEYNTIKSFVSMLKDTNISLMCYTKNTNM